MFRTHKTISLRLVLVESRGVFKCLNWGVLLSLAVCGFKFTDLSKSTHHKMLEQQQQPSNSKSHTGHCFTPTCRISKWSLWSMRLLVKAETLRVVSRTWNYIRTILTHVCEYLNNKYWKPNTNTIRFKCALRLSCVAYTICVVGAAAAAQPSHRRHV